MDDLKTEELLKKEIEELKKKNRFLISALDSMPNPVFIKDSKAEFVFFNKKYEEQFGMKKEDYIGKSVMDLDYLPLYSRIQYQKEDIDNIENTKSTSREKTFLFSDGLIHTTLYWAMGFKAKETEEMGLVGEIVDISKEKILQENLDEMVVKLKSKNVLLSNQTLVDCETGLYNKTKLYKVIKQYNSGKKNYDYLLLADLDFFKRVNDIFGHLQGDAILRKFSKILKKLCGSNLVIRYGGEEFLVLFKSESKDRVLNLAEKIRLEAKKKLILPDNTNLSVSLGVIKINKNTTMRANIKLVDEALYAAKKNGRDCVEYDDN